MYSVSPQYQIKINEAIRSTKLRGQLIIGAQTIPLTEEDIAPGSVSYSNQCVDKDDFSIGSVFAGTLKLSIYDTVTTLDLKGAKLSLEFGLVTSVGVVEYVPIGIFNIIDAYHRLTTIVISALDNMILLDVDLPSQLVGTPDQLLVMITEATGVLIENVTVSTFPNGTDMVTVIPCESLKTYRDLLMWLCEYMSAFATMSRLGKIWIRHIFETPVEQIPAIVRFKSPLIKDESVKITSLKAKFSSTMYEFNLALTPNDGKTYNIGDNPLFWTFDDIQAGYRLENILNALGTVSYVPSEVEYNGNPALDVGDYVWLLGTVRGDVLTRITSLSWKSKAKSKIKSVGLSSILKTTNDLSYRENKTRTEALVDKVKNEVLIIASTVSDIENQVNGVDGIEHRLDSAELKITPTSILSTVKSVSGIADNETLASTSYVQTTSDATKVAAAKVVTDQYGKTISDIQTNFIFDTSGLTIKKSTSNFAVKISDTEMGFYDGPTKTAYVNNGEFYIGKGTVISSLTIGSHKIEKYSSGITIFRYVG